MASLTIRNVQKNLGGQPVLKGVSLTVADRELFCLLGPSGCGKTTILRLVAGFLDPDAGSLLIDGTALEGVPPWERNVSLVFQNYALWPHLTVLQNVTFGLEMRGLGKGERLEKARQTLSLVQMDRYETRYPAQLSGGQQQRVALARALALSPRVMLFDEPLSNLDAALRYELRQQIKKIHSETGVTMLYVTHDQQEAFSIADRVAILRDGEIQQTGTPAEILKNPANDFVRSFVQARQSGLPGETL